MQINLAIQHLDFIYNPVFCWTHILSYSFFLIKDRYACVGFKNLCASNISQAMGSK